MTAAFVDNFQHRLGKIRPPRVQITYDVEIGDAFEKISLPFVMGILADLTHDPDVRKTLPKLKERKFTEIDRDTFGSVMKKCQPTLRKSVEYTPPGATDAKKLGLSLTFDSMGDFSPSGLTSKVPEMAALLHKRLVLRDLQSRLDGNDALMDVMLELAAQPAEKQGLLDKIKALRPPEQSVPSLPPGKDPSAGGGEEPKPEEPKPEDGQG